MIRAPKKISETSEQYATLSAFDKSGGGLLTDKDLRDRQLSHFLKHSRKTITGREFFKWWHFEAQNGPIDHEHCELENGDYGHDHMDHFVLQSATIQLVTFSIVCKKGNTDPP